MAIGRTVSDKASHGKVTHSAWACWTGIPKFFMVSGHFETSPQAQRKVEKLSPARRVYAIRKVVVAWIVALAVMAPALWPADATAAESRYASIIVDADTGKVLSAYNPDRPSYPASLTKMMTLYLLFDALDQGKIGLDTPLPVSAHAAAQAPSKLALRPGDHISVEDAVLALVTKSANDVAVTIAEALGGSESAFAAMMTRKAHALGMTATTYRNASGLPNSGQMTTPRDQAILARALVRNHSHYYHYFATRQFNWRGQIISTHNRVVLNYPGADGIKTGYINASGFNLVSSAVRDGHRLVGVVFGGDTASWRDRRMMELLDRGFARIGVGDTQLANADEEEPKPPAVVKASKQAKKHAKVAKGKAAKATPRETAMGDNEPVSWAIQVGAFEGYKPAHHAAASAAKKLGGLIARASISVDKGKLGKQRVYRARLTGFTEDQASAACRKLAKSRKECRVVQPNV